MNFKKKSFWGLILIIIGCLGIIFASSLGFTALPRPWSFITGFITGIIVSLGIGLAIPGLIESKRKRNN